MKRLIKTEVKKLTILKEKEEDQAFFQQLNTQMNDLDIYNCTCIISFSIICPA